MCLFNGLGLAFTMLSPLFLGQFYTTGLPLVAY